MACPQPVAVFLRIAERQGTGVREQGNPIRFMRLLDAKKQKFK